MVEGGGNTGVRHSSWVESVGSVDGVASGIFRLETFAGNFRLVTSVWNLSLGNFRLGSFAWELSIGNFRSGKSPFSLNNAIFVCTCLLVLVVVLVNYGGGTRRKLFGE